MTSTLEVLVNARKLIEKPENWFGSGEFALGDDARRCALFALGAAGAEEYFAEDPAKVAFCVASGAAIGNIGGWNDTHTHDEVLAAFDRAIETERLAGLSDDRTDGGHEGKLS